MGQGVDVAIAQIEPVGRERRLDRAADIGGGITSRDADIDQIGKVRLLEGCRIVSRMIGCLCRSS
jgi:hypothetical protein